MKRVKEFEDDYLSELEKYCDWLEGKLKATAKICDIQEQQIKELEMAQLVRCPECGFKTIQQALKK